MNDVESSGCDSNKDCYWNWFFIEEKIVWSSMHERAYRKLITETWVSL